MVDDTFRTLRKGMRDLRVMTLKHMLPPRPRRRRLNLGGGRWYRPRWENIDQLDDPHFVDHRIDLRENPRLPVEDACTELVYSSHCLEHVEDHVAALVLADCHRAMIPGGTIRIAVPDMDKAFSAYRSRDHSFFDYGGVTCPGDSLEEKLVCFFASYVAADYRGGPKVPVAEIQAAIGGMHDHDFCRWCVSRIPAHATNLGHVNAYDFAKLRDLLDAAGFTEIRRSSYRASAVPTLRNAAFDNRPTVSLYVEALR